MTQHLEELRQLLIARLRREEDARPVASDDCPVLDAWRAAMIPKWRAVLEDSRANGDADVAKEALWWLREVLLDRG